MEGADYLDDMFSALYRQQPVSEGLKEPQSAKEKKRIQPKRKEKLEKESLKLKLSKSHQNILSGERRSRQNNNTVGPQYDKSISKKQMNNLVRIYGSKDFGANIYGNFDKKKNSYKPSDDLMKKSLTETSIPVPQDVPGELTYANRFKPVTNEDQIVVKKKKKRSKKKTKKNIDDNYAVVGMQHNPLSSTEKLFYQHASPSATGKKNISFRDFNTQLNEAADSVPKDDKKEDKKNCFQINAILKGSSRISKQLNDSLQYSYLFSPKRDDGERVTSEAENDKSSYAEKNSIDLISDHESEKPLLNVKLSGGSDIQNFPEWTSLRDNYIQQLQNLNYHQELVQKTDAINDISIPNFIGLLLAIRKISFRIVDKYRQIILYGEKYENFKEMNAYIIKMATDVNCINRQPFVDWMGISPLFNTFFSDRKIDGTTALFADRPEPPKGIKIQGLGEDSGSEDVCKALHRELYAKKPVYMRKELLMTDREREMVEELGKVIWHAYCTYQEAMHHKQAAETIQSMVARDHDENFENEHITPVPADVQEELLQKGGALENHSLMQIASNASLVTSFSNIRPLHLKNHLKVSWRKWRRLFTITTGLRNMQEGRIYCIKRKVLYGWQKYSWQNIEFRRLQQRRWMQLLTFTFDGWCQYLYWCRKFNRVLKAANHENMRRVLKRMRIFSLYVHDNRKFKWKQFHMPLIVTFRALRDNAKINK